MEPSRRGDMLSTAPFGLRLPYLSCATSSEEEMICAKANSASISERRTTRLSQNIARLIDVQLSKIELQTSGLGESAQNSWWLGGRSIWRAMTLPGTTCPASS